MRDWRSADEILAQPRWKGLHASAQGLDTQALRDVDRLLARCEAEGIAHVDDITEALIDSVDAGSVSAYYQHRLVKALARLLPGTALAQRAAACVLRRRQRSSAGRSQPTPKRTRAASKSLPESDLPLAWRDALATMRAGVGTRTDRAPAPSIVETIAMKLRQLARSATDRGLPVALSLEAIGALHDDMQARGVTASTRRATTSALARFAQYIAAPQEIRDELRRVTSLHDASKTAEIKRKEKVLHKTDVSARAVLAKARDLLAEATTTTNPRSAHSRRNEAFCLSFFTLLPIRLSDARLTFGEDLIWAGGSWNLCITTSKNGVDYAAKVHPHLEPYIEALILQGLDPVYLDQRREACLADRRPALVTWTGEGVGYNYVSDVWRKYFGIGEHIARTEMHESFAARLGVEGTELALRACGQRSPQSAKHYHGQRIRQTRMTRMQDGLQALATDLPGDAFTL